MGEEEGNSGIPVGPVLASPVYNGGGIPDSDLSAITHDDRLAILDEYFQKAVTRLGPFDGVLAVESPMSATSPAILTRTSDPGAEALRESETSYPERAIDSVKECCSAFLSESPGLVSTSINLTRYSLYETTVTDVDSLDAPVLFTKRAVLDKGSQLLEHVLIALDSLFNNRRAPVAYIPGVLDKVYSTSDHEVFVRVMTSIRELG